MARRSGIARLKDARNARLARELAQHLDHPLAVEHVAHLILTKRRCAKTRPSSLTKNT